MFHVKHSVNPLNEGILLSYTELPEDHVEDVLDIDPAQKPAEGMRRGPEVFSDEFVALPGRCDGCDAANPPSPQQASAAAPA